MSSNARMYMAISSLLQRTSLCSHCCADVRMKVAPGVADRRVDAIHASNDPRNGGGDCQKSLDYLRGNGKMAIMRIKFFPRNQRS